MDKPKWKKRAKWIAGILAVHYLLAGELSPLTYYRAHLLGERICEAAEAGMFDEPKGHYEFTDLLYVGPSLTKWFNVQGKGLKSQCENFTDFVPKNNSTTPSISLTGSDSSLTMKLRYSPLIYALGCIGDRSLCGVGLVYWGFSGSRKLPI